MSMSTVSLTVHFEISQCFSRTNCYGCHCRSGGGVIGGAVKTTKEI